MGKIILIPCSFIVILVVFSCDPLEVKEHIICSDWEDTCFDQTTSIDSSKSDRNVLIIGFDGFRADGMRQDVTPFLYEFSKRNTTYFTDKQLAEERTISGPNWSSLLTGVHLCKHNVLNNDFDFNQLGKFHHFFKYVEQADSSINTISIVRWTPINERITFNFADYANLSGLSDEEVFNRAMAILKDKDPNDADIMFLHFLGLDEMGHKFGFSSDVPEYRNKLSLFDEYVRELVSVIEEKRKNGEDWMIFIVSDHGGDGTGHFDPVNKFIRYTIFYANHPEMEFMPAMDFVSSQVDLVPTILDFMGITSEEFNCKRDGNSLLY